MAANVTSVKSGQLLKFLQLKCQRLDTGTVVIDKVGLLDLVQKFQGNTLERRNSISKKLRRVLQDQQFVDRCVGTGLSDFTNTRYTSDVIPDVMGCFNLRIDALGWSRLKNILEERARNGLLSLDSGLVPVQPVQQTSNEDTGASGAAGSTVVAFNHHQSIHRTSDDLHHEARSVISLGPDTYSDSNPSVPARPASSKSVPLKRSNSTISTISRASVDSLETDSKRRRCDGVQDADNSNIVATFPASVSSGGGAVEELSNLQKKLAEYRQEYQGSTTDDLLREIALKDHQIQSYKGEVNAKDQKIGELKHKLRLEKQRIRRLTASNIRLQEKMKSGGKSGKGNATNISSSVEQKMAIERPGKKGRYLTIPSRASLAIRRNLSNAACADVALILLDDASRYTIARSEVFAGSALVAAAQAFHQVMDEERSKGPIFSVHMITQDATNSSIIQKKKLTALILNSAYVTLDLLEQVSTGQGKGKVPYVWDFNKIFQSTQCVADVQPVDDGSAAGTVALTSKMLASIGCPSIQSLVSSPPQDQEPTRGDGEQRLQRT